MRGTLDGAIPVTVIAWAVHGDALTIIDHDGVTEGVHPGRVSVSPVDDCLDRADSIDAIFGPGTIEAELLVRRAAACRKDHP